MQAQVGVERVGGWGVQVFDVQRDEPDADPAPEVRADQVGDHGLRRARRRRRWGRRRGRRPSTPSPAHDRGIPAEAEAGVADVEDAAVGVGDGGEADPEGGARWGWLGVVGGHIVTVPTWRHSTLAQDTASLTAALVDIYSESGHETEVTDAVEASVRADRAPHGRPRW